MCQICCISTISWSYFHVGVLYVNRFHMWGLPEDFALRFLLLIEPLSPWFFSPLHWEHAVSQSDGDSSTPSQPVANWLVFLNQEHCDQEVPIIATNSFKEWRMFPAFKYCRGNHGFHAGTRDWQLALLCLDMTWRSKKTPRLDAFGPYGLYFSFNKLLYNVICPNQWNQNIVSA